MTDWLHVGDLVRQRHGYWPKLAVVVEDNGRIGIGGRQIVTIEVSNDSIEEECIRFEMAAAMLEKCDV